MKKIALAVAMLLCLFGTAAAQRHIEYKWHGFYAVVDGSYVMNLNRTPGTGMDAVADTLSGYSVSASAGFQFRKEAGVGAGLTFISDPTGAFTQLPLYVELRSHFLRSRLTPYTNLQFGYTLPLGSSSESVKVETGGLYVGLELGGRFAIDRSFGIGAHVGYKLLNLREVTRTDMQGHPLNSDVRSLHVLSVGISMHF